MKLFKRAVYFFCASCRPNRSITVRYAFPLIFVIAALLGASAIVSDNKSFIHLDPSVRSVKAGDQFQIKVYVTASVPVNAVDIELKFPADQIAITNISKAQSVITLWTQDPSVKNNTVILSGGTFQKGFIGDHLIATINAKAIQTGLATFSTDKVSLYAGNGSGSQVQVTESDTDKASLYIANGDGSYVPGTGAVGVKGDTSVYIITDIDGDGVVTLSDISRFMSNWMDGGKVVYDFNGDGKMDFVDFGIILADSFFKR